MNTLEFIMLSIVMMFIVLGSVLLGYKMRDLDVMNKPTEAELKELRELKELVNLRDLKESGVYISDDNQL